MAKPKKITFIDIVNSLRRGWTRNPKTIVQKNKKKSKSRQQKKIDLKRRYNEI